MLKMKSKFQPTSIHFIEANIFVVKETFEQLCFKAQRCIILISVRLETKETLNASWLVHHSCRADCSIPKLISYNKAVLPDFELEWNVENFFTVLQPLLGQ